MKHPAEALNKPIKAHSERINKYRTDAIKSSNPADHYSDRNLALLHAKAHFIPMAITDRSSIDPKNTPSSRRYCKSA